MTTINIVIAIAAGWCAGVVAAVIQDELFELPNPDNSCREWLLWTAPLAWAVLAGALTWKVLAT